MAAFSSSIPAEETVWQVMQVPATICFALAVLHTFAVKQITAFGHRFRQGSILENLFHFLGEVEVVFGLWTAVLFLGWSFSFGTKSVAYYLDHVNFTEACFVFVIICMAATRPVLALARNSIFIGARLLPIPQVQARYFVIVAFGPLLGSLITEPAAMTVCALLLLEQFYSHPVSTRFRYATLGLLFVNISIGGVLTHFAAPPVLMVARTWSWDTPYVFSNFGWRAMLSVILLGLIYTAAFWRDLGKIPLLNASASTKGNAPLWVSLVHLFFIALTVWHSHYAAFFIPLFLLFLGWTAVSEEFQDPLRLRQSLLVAFFLGGLVALGQLQAWWLQPIIAGMPDSLLFWGALGLTAFTDNAAITYLASLVPNFSEQAKFAVVAGAVTGGGLTVIANAPNPAGYSILRQSFGEDGINPLGLFLGALPPTIVAAIFMLL